jgi:hypothetical protein
VSNAVKIGAGIAVTLLALVLVLTDNIGLGLLLALGLAIAAIAVYLGVFERKRDAVPSWQARAMENYTPPRVPTTVKMVAPIGDVVLRRQVERAIRIAGMPCDPRVPGAWTPESI